MSNGEYELDEVGGQPIIHFGFDD